MSNAGRLLLVASTLAAVACGGDPNAPPAGEQADVRLLHVSPGSGSLALEVGGQTVASGISYGQSSPLVRVAGGAQRLTVRAGNTVVGTIDANLDTRHVNGVVALDAGIQLTPQPEADTGVAAPTRANIRFVIVAAENTSPPTQLNALMSGTSIPADSTLRFGIDATVPRYWALTYWDPGRFTIKYVPLGTNGPVLAETTFDVATGETKAVVLRRDAAGSYRVEVVVER